MAVTGYTDDDSGQSCSPWDLGRRLPHHFHRKSPTMCNHPMLCCSTFFILFTAICLWVCCFWKSILSINDDIIVYIKVRVALHRRAQHTSKFGNQSASGEAFPPLRPLSSPRKPAKHVTVIAMMKRANLQKT